MKRNSTVVGRMSMKIASKEITGSGAVEKTTQVKRATSTDFKEVLEKAQIGSQTTANCGIALPPSMQVPVISLSPVDSSAEKKLISEVDDFLNLMEEYQNKMEDPAVSLKQIQPLVEKMGTETERLRSTLETLPEASTMKDILNRALVASSVEVIKFNRGDYL